MCGLSKRCQVSPLFLHKKLPNDLNSTSRGEDTQTSPTVAVEVMFPGGVESVREEHNIVYVYVY